MKKNLTEIAVILDESGSMSSCKHDTIGGFNEFIKTQSKIEGDATVTFVKFSDYYKIINEGSPIEKVEKLNECTYTPTYSTALLDAVGRTINSIGTRLSKLPESERPEKVMIVIITDGYENASKEYSKTQIFDMVKHQREKYQWEFLFLGADIDSWGGDIGIKTNVNIDKSNMSKSFKSLSYYTANYRTNSAERGIDNFDLSDTELDVKLNAMSKK